MKTQGINLGDGGEPAVSRAAIAEVILWMNLNPGWAFRRRGVVEHMGIMHRFQAYATRWREGARHRHG